MNTSRALTLFLALALLALVFLVLSTPAARAADPVIVRVTTSGTTAWPCGQGNWSNPCALQTALSNTLPGSELWVAVGTYTPTTGTDRTATFQLRDNVALYGGFAGGETLRSQRNFTANITILSGDIGVPGNASDNAYHVVTGSGVTNTAVLDGFAVTGGRADGPYPYDYGSGIYNYQGGPTVANATFFGNWAADGGGGMYNNQGNPTLFNVTFSNNSTGFAGGGMENTLANPVLTSVIFSGNSATTGGGMFNSNSSPTLVSVTFIGNTAINNGGGMMNGNGSATLTNVAFISNTAGTTGGGLDNFVTSPALTSVTFMSNSATTGGAMTNIGSSPIVTNVTFISNTASTHGGGMYNYNGSPVLTNVTFSGNSATDANGYGGGMENDEVNPIIRNAIFWGNTAPFFPDVFNEGSFLNFTDSVVQGGCPDNGTFCRHIITADPRLGALGSYGGSTQTVPLLSGSSAIDAGDDAICPATDQRGIRRPQGLHCDIGAFEFEFARLQLPLIRR